MKKLMLSIAAVLMSAAMLTTSAFAAFTPSVENKGAPDVVTTEDENGNSVVAIIKDADGNEVIGVPGGELIVTSIAKADEAPKEAIKKQLEKAYEQIKKSGLLSELTAQVNQHIKEFNEALRKELGATAAAKEEVSVEDLIVRDLFDVSVFGTYEDYLNEEGNTITIRFKVGIRPDAYLAVLHNYTGDKWEVIPDNRVTRHANGDVSVTFDSLSPVAFVVNQKELEGYEAVETANGPTSPQTSDIDFMPWIAAAIVLAGAVVLVVRKAHKRG